MPDEYLLFGDLPFDFQSELPHDLGNGVFLVNPRPVYNVLDADEQLAVLVAPDRQAGLGEVHVALRRAHTHRVGAEQARDDLWNALLALRLARPVSFRTTACLAIEDGRIAAHGIAQAALEPRSGAMAADFGRDACNQAKRINRRIKALRGRGMERVRSAIIIFSHITMGRVSSWQLSVLGLFACLECLFPQPPSRMGQQLAAVDRNYGDRLARRVSTFLETTQRPPRLRSWLATAYDKRRNPLAHGFHGIRLSSRGSIQRTRILRKLHETARLTLLGFLGFTNQDLRRLLPPRADDINVQNAIDQIGPAPTPFLDGQRFWS